MYQTLWPWFLLALSILLNPTPLAADWELRKIDADTSLSSTKLDGDLAAYERDGDIHLFRFSSQLLTRVTQDLNDPVDLIIDLNREKLWFWAHAWGDPVYDLYEYDAQSEWKTRLLTTEAAVTLDYGVEDAGRLIIGMDHDWWLWTNGASERLTFSGESLTKQQPRLEGDYLVWRAVAGTPGVYVTYLPTRETRSIYEDYAPPGSLCVSGPHVTWVDRPVAMEEETRVFHYRLDTRTVEIVGTSEESASQQLALQPPHLIWLKKMGPSWMIMRTNLEDGAEECLYVSELPMLGALASANDILLVTQNCPGSYEKCWELSVFDQGTGLFSQLTRFGTGSMIFSPRIDSGRIAFVRHSTLFPYVNEAFVGFKTPNPQCGTLSRTGGVEPWINLAFVFAPLAIIPWLHRRRIRRNPSEQGRQIMYRFAQMDDNSARRNNHHRHHMDLRT
jgi:hypothetical protein